MKYALTTFALIILLAAAGPALDGLNDSLEAEAAAQEAHQVAQREKRKNKAGQALCGNGSLIWIDDQTMNCGVRKTGGFK